MAVKLLKVLPAAAAAFAMGSVPVVAQTGVGAIYTVVVPAGEFGSAAYLKELLSVLASARAFCGEIGNSAYRVDCLAERLEAVSDSIPKGTDYDEVRSVLEETSSKMARLARQNRDASLPRGTAASPSGVSSTRPLTPVAAESQAAVNQQAIAILEEARTTLLRSAAGGQERQSQYAQIAEAIDSNKLLLRS